MKFLFLFAGFLLGYGFHSLVDMRTNYAQSVVLAEANCALLALSNPEIELDPAGVDCKLIVDDDFILTFEVNEGAGGYLDCLPGSAFFRSEVSVGQCRHYKR